MDTAQMNEATFEHTFHPLTRSRLDIANTGLFAAHVRRVENGVSPNALGRTEPDRADVPPIQEFPDLVDHFSNADIGVSKYGGPTGPTGVGPSALPPLAEGLLPLALRWRPVLS